jgi:hypothetical protein
MRHLFANRLVLVTGVIAIPMSMRSRSCAQPKAMFVILALGCYLLVSGLWAACGTHRRLVVDSMSFEAALESGVEITAIAHMIETAGPALHVLSKTNDFEQDQ